ncbi:hypothetical protein [Clostridium cellulovorans]|nr:hypothetical protein [Clostridium cellulovorans]
MNIKKVAVNIKRIRILKIEKSNMESDSYLGYGDHSIQEIYLVIIR